MNNVVKTKPVATVGTTAVVATAALNYATYRGWLPAGWDVILSPLAVLVLGVIVHALVSPYQKVKDVVERGLNITDADFGRMEALVEQYGLQLLPKVTPAAPQLPSPGSGA